jgi:hypothetical protein
MWIGESQAGSSNFGDATMIDKHFALLLATFIRLGLYKKAIPLGASAAEEHVIE